MGGRWMRVIVLSLVFIYICLTFLAMLATNIIPAYISIVIVLWVYLYAVFKKQHDAFIVQISLGMISDISESVSVWK